MLLSLAWATVYSLWIGVSSAQIDLSKTPALRVHSNQEGLLLLDLPPPPQKVQLTPFVVFVRPEENEFEIIARGRVETIQNGKVLVTVDRDAVIKFPIPGDLGVPMGSPKDWPPGMDPNILEPPVQAEPAEEPGDPGYIEFTWGRLSGSGETSGSDGRSNEYKDIPQYGPASFHFTWYWEFLWQLGLEYETTQGSFPTSTYYRDIGESTEKSQTVVLNWRFRRRWLGKKLRPALRVLNHSSEFTTLNPDEALIGSKLSGNGYGARLSYELDSAVWTPDPRRTGFRFQQAYADFNYFPDVAVQDTGDISRGLGKGTITELKVGATALVYLNFIPWVKRYSIELGYAQRVTQIGFSGETQSELGGFYPIPENQSSLERFSWFYVSVGVRFEDVIGKFIKPR